MHNSWKSIERWWLMSVFVYVRWLTAASEALVRWSAGLAKEMLTPFFHTIQSLVWYNESLSVSLQHYHYQSPSVRGLAKQEAKFSHHLLGMKINRWFVDWSFFLKQDCVWLKVTYVAISLESAMSLKAI